MHPPGKRKTMTLISVHGEEADVFHIGGNLAVAPYAEVCLGKGAAWLDDDAVLLPFLAADLYAGVAQLLVFVHRGVINEINPQLGAAAVWHACPEGETVLFAALDADAEETVVLNHRVLVAVARGSQTYVVRVALKGTVVLQ